MAVHAFKSFLDVEEQVPLRSGLRSFEYDCSTLWLPKASRKTSFATYSRSLRPAVPAIHPYLPVVPPPSYSSLAISLDAFDADVPSSPARAPSDEVF